MIRYIPIKATSVNGIRKRRKLNRPGIYKASSGIEVSTFDGETTQTDKKYCTQF